MVVAAEPPMAGLDLRMRIRIHAAGTTLPGHAMHGLYSCRDGLTIRSSKRFSMAWVYLLVAGVLEVVWAFTMKQSHGFTNLKYSAITIVV